MAGYKYLIVGGGMAADAAVGGIRELDAGGAIGLIGGEPHRPYNRPPLSKALWKGESEDSIWRAHTAEGVALHLGRRAVRLDPGARSVTDDRGTVHTFERVLLATGGAPRRFPLVSPRVIYFRTLDDFRRLKAYAAEPLRFVVVGGGFIGSEIAAALRLNGRDVTMLFPEAGLGGRVFTADLSAFLVQYYREQGVQVLTGESVAAVEDRNHGVLVRTTGGREVEGDVLVAGLGIQPEVALAEQAGLRVENGIVVDQHLRASHPDVSAAGDVASFYSPALGRRIRVEHEDNANTMGRAAGRAMAGDPEPWRHLPFFYSDLFDLGYEAVGDLDARLEAVADWKDPFREGVIYYVAQGRVRGVLLWNTWGQVDAARALIAEPGPFRPADLKGRLPA